MEVIKDNAALLSNIEVLSLLENLKTELKESKYAQRLNKGNRELSEKEKGLQRLNTIVYETVKYLEEVPSATQTPESVKKFLIAVAPYSLTKAEKLQLLNMRPTSLVEIQLLIEESEERFNEEQMNEILALVSEILPPGPETDSKPSSEADYADNG